MHRVLDAADRAEARADRKEERREGRGRLSSMDLVPEEAQEDIIWAVGELNKRERTASEILFELNDRLDAKGIDPISKSAFNRKSVKLAAMSNRLNEARYIFQGLAPQFTAEKVDEHTMVLGEFIKLLIFELVQADGGAVGSKGAMELARAHLAVIQGQKISSERRLALQREFAAGAEKAIDTVAKEKGLSGETVRGIKEKILGLKLPAAPAGGTP
ncbi:phage protein Gp27 family protein [Methylobacterium iners]|uniref:phage protein Gp27 family protein n=1 Tax=Methylobacterium iners TaxID=418707 RepID=UPI00361BBC64